MHRVTLRSGETVPQLGQGTWKMGENAARRQTEVKALRRGIDLGMTLLDTAEMYGEGGAEEVVAEAAKGQRDKLFIVSKVYPHNASRQGTVQACERSLKRLRTDRIDLYLLHWPGSYPLADTVAAFEELRQAGKVRMWGISNFDAKGMAKVLGETGGGNCAANQVLYNLSERGIEWDLMKACAAAKVAVMAYTPIGRTCVISDKSAIEVARRHGVQPAAVAIAWTMRDPNVISIPKSSNVDHVEANRQAVDLKLGAEDLALLDKAFPPPRKATPLSVL
ncbi:MAG: aldo/keto reductase [Hyphomicrobiaceae bacterium]